MEETSRKRYFVLGYSIFFNKKEDAKQFADHLGVSRSQVSTMFSPKQTVDVLRIDISNSFSKDLKD